MNAAARAQANRTLLAAILATVAMLFTAFAAAYLERRGGAGVWSTVELPGLLWLNTALLAVSSVTMELARRGRGGVWLTATIVLGCLFLTGQLGVWSELRAAGVYLPTSAHSSFLYILSGLHGVHVLGGLIALFVAAFRRGLVGLCAGYWHFMGLAWLYILVILAVV